MTDIAKVSGIEIASVASVAGIEAAKIMGLTWPAGSSYADETIAYQSRVEADGGTIVSLDDIDTAIVHAKDNNYYSSIKRWYCSQFGYKNAGAGAVSKWYDLSTNNVDASAGTSPIWTANQLNGKAALLFDGTMGLTFTAVSNPGLAITVCKKNTGESDKRVVLGGTSNGILVACSVASTGNGTDNCCYDGVTTVQGPSGAHDAWRILSSIVVVAQSTLALRRDGSSGDTGVLGVHGNSLTRIGTYSTAGYDLSGGIAMVMIFDISFDGATLVADIEDLYGTMFGI